MACPPGPSLKQLSPWQLLMRSPVDHVLYTLMFAGSFNEWQTQKGFTNGALKRQSDSLTCALVFLSLYGPAANKEIPFAKAHGRWGRLGKTGAPSMGHRAQALSSGGSRNEDAKGKASGRKEKGTLVYVTNQWS